MRWLSLLGGVACLILVGGCSFMRCVGFCRGEPAPPAPTALASEPMTLEKLWSADGNWTGVAVDTRTGEVYAMLSYGGVDGWTADFERFGRDGTSLGKFKLQSGLGGSPTFVRVAHFGADAPQALVLFGTWSSAVDAFTTDGKHLWHFQAPSGVDDVYAADLDGDGVDEIVVGLNGYGRLHVLNADGTERWMSSKVGNVWGVTAVPAGDAGRRRVVALGGMYGAVEMFGPDGGAAGSVRLTIYEPIHVRPAVLPDRHGLVFTTLGGYLGLEVTDLEGQLLWARVDRRAGASTVFDFDSSPDKPLAAVALKDGAVIVYDLVTGDRLASTCVGWWQRPAWIPATESSPEVLVVSSPSGLTALVLKEKDVSVRPDE